LFLFKIKREINDIKRLREIARVISKYGLGYLIVKFNLQKYAAKHVPAETLRNEPLSVRVRKILEELGPTFIKLGQMLSLRPDIMPPEYCKEFEKLQDNVPPVEFSLIKEVLEREFKKPLGKVFKDFPETPLASASLSQVYKVTLGNKEAIVKVLKPDVEKIVRADIEILAYLANHIDKNFPESRLYDPKGLIEQFKGYILNELNFNNEIVNIDTFRHNFLHDKTVYTPVIYDKLCTNRVMVIEYIEGIKLRDVQKLKKEGLDTGKIAQSLIACVLKQVFIDGFFHGDPHPGNIFVLLDGKIAFIDFGVIGRIDDVTRFGYAHVFAAAASNDVDMLMKVLKDSGGVGYYINEVRLRLSLSQLLDKYYGVTVENFNMNDFLTDLTKILHEHKVHIPADNILLFKALGMLESEARMLDPEINFTPHIQSVAEEIIKDEYSVERVAKKIRLIASDIFGLIQNLPKDIFTIINELKQGKLKIGFEHLNLEDLVAMLDTISNRLSFSLIISALIVGSSYLTQSTSSSFLGPVHRLGVLGFAVSGALGLWIIFKILRSRRF